MDFEALRAELQHVVNKHNLDNHTGTPDFILADMMTAQLKAFTRAVRETHDWHGGNERTFYPPLSGHEHIKGQGTFKVMGRENPVIVTHGETGGLEGDDWSPTVPRVREF